MWPVFEEREKMIVPWRKGSILGPPNLWHCTEDPHPNRNRSLSAGRRA